jgi:dihydroorotate dehydrogenase (fumarate)
MASLGTTYMGLQLKNPFIAGASGYTANPERIKKLEAAGAAAVVTASLFEEQVQYERFRLEEDLHRYDNLYAEMTEFYPREKHGGPKEHLLWVRRAKEGARIPVIASLNAVTREIWSDWAQQLEGTGVDGLELNFYATPSDFERAGDDIEREQLAILGEVRAKVKVPISVKLSPYYTNPLHTIKRMEEAGVQGFVLFNRLFQPDIDVDAERNRYPHSLSSEAEHRLPLRYCGLLNGRLQADVCASGGVLSGRDALKMILAGATCVQVVSVLYRRKPAHLAGMIEEVERWMDGKRYDGLSSFRGRMNAANNQDPGFYRRAQYVRQLLKADYTEHRAP